MEPFAYHIVESARMIRREVDRRSVTLGTTGAQWRVLACLSRRDGQRQVEIADTLDIEPITLCRMVDRLEEARLVERRRDEADRRAWRIHLTAKATPVIAKFRTLAAGFHDEILAGIDPADIAAAERVLTAIRDNLGAMDKLDKAS